MFQVDSVHLAIMEVLLTAEVCNKQLLLCIILMDSVVKRPSQYMVTCHLFVFIS